MGIADAVFLVFREQLAVTAVDAGSKFKVIELSAEGFVFLTAPDFGQGLLLDVAEGTVGDLPADIVQIGVAVVQQGHAGTDLAVGPNEGHAFPDKLAVAGFAQHRLVIEIKIEILLAHEAADAVGRFPDVHVEVRQADGRQDAALAWAGIHVHEAGIEHLILRGFVRGGNVGHIHLIYQVLGDEEGQLCQLMEITSVQL